MCCEIKIEIQKHCLPIINNDGVVAGGQFKKHCILFEGGATRVQIVSPSNCCETDTILSLSTAAQRTAFRKYMYVYIKSLCQPIYKYLSLLIEPLEMEYVT